MPEADPVYAYIDKQIADAKQEVYNLQNQVVALQRVLVESRAAQFTERVCESALVRKANKPRTTARSLALALSNLRGRLAEDAFPDEAYATWLQDIRKRLLRIFKPQDVESLLYESFPWKDVIGFQDVDDQT
jgi:hypothetical protein